MVTTVAATLDPKIESKCWEWQSLPTSVRSLDHLSLEIKLSTLSELPTSLWTVSWWRHIHCIFWFQCYSSLAFTLTATVWLTHVSHSLFRSKQVFHIVGALLEWEQQRASPHLSQKIHWGWVQNRPLLYLLLCGVSFHSRSITELVHMLPSTSWLNTAALK